MRRIRQPGIFATLKVGRDETIGQHLYELGNGWDIPELRRLLEEVIPKSTAVVDYEVEHDFPSIGRRTMLVSAHRLFHPDNNSRTLLLSIVDATERRQLEAEKDVLLGELRHGKEYRDCIPRSVQCARAGP
nr:PAS domain-containing protein [Sinorhizobium meliloti]